MLKEWIRFLFLWYLGYLQFYEMFEELLKKEPNSGSVGILKQIIINYKLINNYLPIICFDNQHPMTMFFMQRLC